MFFVLCLILVSIAVLIIGSIGILMSFMDYISESDDSQESA